MASMPGTFGRDLADHVLARIAIQTRMSRDNHDVGMLALAQFGHRRAVPHPRPIRNDIRDNAPPLPKLESCGVVMPTTAIFTPATVFKKYGANGCTGASGVATMFDEIQGKCASARAFARFFSPKLNS